MCFYWKCSVWLNHILTWYVLFANFSGTRFDLNWVQHSSKFTNCKNELRGYFISALRMWFICMQCVRTMEWMVIKGSALMGLLFNNGCLSYLMCDLCNISDFINSGKSTTIFSVIRIGIKKESWAYSVKWVGELFTQAIDQNRPCLFVK